MTPPIDFAKRLITRKKEEAAMPCSEFHDLARRARPLVEELLTRFPDVTREDLALALRQRTGRPFALAREDYGPPHIWPAPATREEAAAQAAARLLRRVCEDLSLQLSAFDRPDAQAVALEAAQ